MNRPIPDPGKRIQAMAQKGYRGYPIGTVAYYGPNDQVASKIAVGIVLEEAGPVEFMEKWLSPDVDVRHDAGIQDAVLAFLESHRVRSVALTPGIYGCPHEEGIDYPEGEVCPHCPFWAGKDRRQIFDEQ
ncbi:MAG: hypothetical protein KAY24_04225 [Candidatus Eisenbacteria sp.]|nr:hypothetical protein [Candidatus Eisenbacteria bacterium]